MELPAYIILRCCVAKAFHPHSPGLTTGNSVALCVLEQNPDHVVLQFYFPYGEFKDNATHYDSLHVCACTYTHTHDTARKREGAVFDK